MSENSKKGRSRAINRTIYTEGENAVVRLPPRIWKAFYEAALYLECWSTQDVFIAYLASGGMLSRYTGFVTVVEQLERHPEALEGMTGNRASRDDV